MSSTTIPHDLTPQQASLWRSLRRSLVGDEFTTGHAQLLRLVVDVHERLADVRKALAGAELVVAGSTGQTRPHPLLAVEAALRAEMRVLLQQWDEAER